MESSHAAQVDAVATTMKAARLYAYGGSNELRFEDSPTPHPQEGQALIRVLGSSVNPWDYKLASGMFKAFMPLDFPYVPGIEFSGIVEETAGASHVKRGDEVYGNCPSGAYAQYVAAPLQTLALKPRTLNFVEAGTIPLAGQTAWQGLFDHGNLQPGQRVLIHGASGGVGTFAVQFARWNDAFVIATAGAANVEYVKQLGADEVIDYEATPFESVVKDIDLVFDLVGGDTQRRSFTVLKPGGKLVATSQPPPVDLAAKHGVEAMMMNMRGSAERLEKMAQLIDNRIVHTVVARVFALSQIREAWNCAISAHPRGKVAIDPVQ